MPIQLQLSPKSREVGLAEERFLGLGEFEKRQKVASRIREIAGWNYSDRDLPGFRNLKKRSHRLQKQAGRYEMCGMQYSVIKCLACSQELIGRRRCEIRICPHCSKKYMAKVRKRQAEIVKRFPRKRTKRWMFFTVTKLRHPLFRPQTSDARNIFRLFRKLFNEFWSKKSGCGALAVLEIGLKGHLHIHALVYGHYVPQDMLSQRWLELTGDSPVVDIRAVKSERKCLNYILKYLTKQAAGQPKQGTDEEEERDEAMEDALQLDLLLGMRRIRTYGVLYNFPLSSKEACPCPLCGGLFKFQRFEEGRLVPSNALFLEEAQALAAKSYN